MIASYSTVSMVIIPDLDIRELKILTSKPLPRIIQPVYRKHEFILAINYVPKLVFQNYEN